MLNIKHITEEGPELDSVRQLFREYETELDEDICFQSFEKELENPLVKYGPPAGDLILAYWNKEIAGCIALAPMGEPGICEMKRLFVKPAYRRNNIGKELVRLLLESAGQKKYSIMRLDTLIRLQPAIGLYKEFGFETIPPYYNNPITGVIYMEKTLGRFTRFKPEGD